MLDLACSRRLRAINELPRRSFLWSFEKRVGGWYIRTSSHVESSNLLNLASLIGYFQVRGKR